MPRQKNNRASLLDAGHKSNLDQQTHESRSEIASSRFRAPRNDNGAYFAASAFSFAMSASLRKLITATLLVRE
jgi:hypothetical protein